MSNNVNAYIFEFATYAKLDNRTMNKILFQRKNVSSVLLKSYDLFKEEREVNKKLYKLEKKYNLVSLYDEDINNCNIYKDLKFIDVLTEMNLNVQSFADLYCLPINSVQNWKNNVSKHGTYLLNTIHRLNIKYKMLSLLENLAEVYKCQSQI